jgi:predicted MFS family arabinose efflux permease
LAPSLLWLMAASLVIGLTAVIAQILIPLATELATRAEQGRTIGMILSGVLLGILLARTVSGIVDRHFGWRSMFWLAAGMALANALFLNLKLPHIPKRARIAYSDLIGSMWRLALELPKLRQVSIVAAMFFAAFSAFWTTLIFRLETPPYHYNSEMAGIFGIFGAAGAAIAPVAGRLSDRRSPRFVVKTAIAVVFVSFVILAAFATQFWGLVLGVILLDIGVQAAQVANQTRILTLRPEARSRVNTVYMICYFGGGSIGSLVGSWAWSRWQWAGVCGTGMALMLIAAIGVLMRGPDPEGSNHRPV